MLILTRRPGETIVIGDSVDFTILGVRGNQVRIGIEAPIEISVHREEIYQKIKQEKEVEKLMKATKKIADSFVSAEESFREEKNG